MVVTHRVSFSAVDSHSHLAQPPPPPIQPDNKVARSVDSQNHLTPPPPPVILPDSKVTRYQPVVEQLKQLAIQNKVIDSNPVLTPVSSQTNSILNQHQNLGGAANVSFAGIDGASSNNQFTGR